jgi:hypothetical protein
MKKLKYPIVLFGIIFNLIFCIACENQLNYVSKNDSAIKIKEDITIFEYVDSDDVPLNYNMAWGLNQLQYSDGYIYVHNNGNRDRVHFPENKTLFKYNVKTNNMTTVCSDPLCKHNEKSCPFFGMFDTMYINKDKILFLRQYTLQLERQNKNGEMFEEWDGYMMYDMSKGKSYIRNEFDSVEFTENARKLFIDDYCLYYDFVYNEEIEEWVFAVMRWDLSTNETVVLAGKNNIYDHNANYSHIMADSFLFVVNSRIYFTDGKTIYSTNKNGEDKIEHLTGSFLLDVFTDGEYIFYGVPIEDNSFIQSIYRVDFDGNNNIELGIIANSRNWEITSKYIYYKKYDEIAIGKNMVSGYLGENITLYGSEIWRCNHDGNNHELVYKFEGDMANYRIHGELYLGNYIYAIYDYWVDSDGDGIFKDGDYYSSQYDNGYYTIMRIDITTGEIYYIKID